MTDHPRLWTSIAGLVLLFRAGSYCLDALKRLVGRFRSKVEKNPVALPNCETSDAESEHLTVAETSDATMCVVANLPPARQSSWSHPQLPRFARWICIYALLLNPSLYLFGTFEPLFHGIYRGTPLGAISLVDACCNIASLLLVGMMVVSGLRLRRMHRSGPIWFIAAAIGDGSLLLIFILYLCFLAPAIPKGPVEPFFLITGLINLLLSLLAAVFEVAAVLWLAKNRGRLRTLFATFGDALPPELPVSRRTVTRFVWTTAAALALCCGGRAMRTNGTSTVPATLTSEQLPLAAQFVKVDWTIKRSLLSDRTDGITGSCGVVEKQGDELLLVTNAHVAGIAEVADAGLLDQGISNYLITVTFPSGASVACTKMAIAENGMDLALLVVPSTGLERGRDYEFLPFGGDLDLHQGEEVVALGAPYGLEGTATYGHISTFRTLDLQNGKTGKAVQIDAAINPGNSGGPLFIRRDGQLSWIGVNTMKMDGQGLGFAIHSGELGKATFKWYSADPAGVQQAINSR